MPFEKGNNHGRGGARVGAGRKKEPKTLVKDALERLDADIPAIFQKLTETALAVDVKAAVYLIDRRLGKPKDKAEIEVDVPVSTLADIARKAIGK